MSDDKPDADSAQTPWIDDAEYRRCLELALNLFDMGVVLSRDGQVAYINDAHQRLVGYSLAELQAVQSVSLVSDDDREAVESRLAERRSGGTVPKSYEASVKHRSGRMVDLHIASAPIAGEAASVLTIVRDVTEARALEKRSRQAHRMEAIGHLASGVAHDLNNYLTAVRLIGEALSFADDNERVTLLAELDHLTEGAARLTHQLLTFGGSEVRRPVVLDVNIIVFEMAAMLERLLGPAIELVVKLEPGLPPLQIAAAQLQQVIVNLVVNAGQAMPTGGRVTVQTSAGDDRLIIVVTDTGQGMEPDVLDRAFEPFFTTRPDDGSGMGLAIVYGIVHAREGSVRIESTTRDGTVVRVELPAASGKDLTPRHASGERMALPSAENVSVLVLEDADRVGRLIAVGLERVGFTVRVSEIEDAPAALEAGSFDALVLGVEGTLATTVQTLRSISTDTFFVFVCTPPELKNSEWESGGYAVLPKPFDIAELAAAILTR